MHCVHMQELLGLPKSSVNSKAAAGTLLMLAVCFFFLLVLNVLCCCVIGSALVLSKDGRCQSFTV